MRRASGWALEQPWSAGIAASGSGTRQPSLALRTSYLSNVFGDDNLDNSILKMMFAYGWNRSNEN